MGRFINVDGYPSTGQGLIGNNMFAYCGNNPITREDQSGQFWDYVVDVGFIAWSIIDVAKNPQDWKNWAGLVVDVALAVVPFVPSGASQIVKVGDKINDAAKAAKKATVIGEAMTRVKDFASTIGAVDNLYDGYKHYSKLASKGVIGKFAAEVIGKTTNIAWLYGKLRAGYTIYDIGVDVTRAARSSSYIVEQTTIFLWKSRNIIKGIMHISREN